MNVIKNSSGKSNEETRAVESRKENIIYQPFGPCSYNNINKLCDFYAVKNTHWRQPHDNFNMAATAVIFWYILCRIYNALSSDGSPT